MFLTLVSVSAVYWQLKKLSLGLMKMFFKPTIVSLHFRNSGSNPVDFLSKFVSSVWITKKNSANSLKFNADCSEQEFRMMYGLQRGSFEMERVTDFSASRIHAWLDFIRFPNDFNLWWHVKSLISVEKAYFLGWNEFLLSKRFFH